MQNELPVRFTFDSFPINDDSDLNWKREIEDRLYDQAEAQYADRISHDEMVYFDGKPLYPLELEKFLCQIRKDERNWIDTEPRGSVEIPSLAYTDRPEYSLMPIYAPRPVYAYSQRSILDLSPCELDDVARQQGKRKRDEDLTELTEKFTRVHLFPDPKTTKESCSARGGTETERADIDTFMNSNRYDSESHARLRLLRGGRSAF
ncbi:hypothetical protein E4T56_gene283 [Termitomyces sp. T112]|nr:hypothetical protein E4T56_gene283 [Termitomyces sp. T112]